jgi:plastocyanin
MLPREPLAALAVGAAIALSAAGCGSDEPPARPQDGALDVVLDDFLIDPQEVRAEPGRLTLSARNEGKIGHTLRVMRGEREVAGIKTLLPGGRGELAATLSRGEYDLVCILGNHEELGMYGTLVVR